jgi:hypothetical protein
MCVLLRVRWCAAKTPSTFVVESDLPHVSGQSSITVAGGTAEPRGEYELAFHPRLGGTYSGSIHFVEQATGRYQWYTVELKAGSPPAEDKLSIEAVVRQGVSLEISLTNPLSEVRLCVRCDDFPVGAFLLVPPHHTQRAGVTSSAADAVVGARVLFESRACVSQLL